MKRKKSHRRALRTSLPLCLGFAFSTGALAQDAAGGQVEGNVEDVVVTAPDNNSVAATSQQQVEEKQSVPVASTILTEKQLQEAQITNLQEAQKLQPSLNIKFGNVRNIAINVRGFGASSSSATDAIFGGSPVYVNGVYQPFVGQAVFEIPDLIGVEVLKGPQATSGGQDNTGGTIHITTALPSFVTQQNLMFQYGSYHQFTVNASATGAVADSDKAAFRIAFFSTDQAGYLYSTTSQQVYDGTHDKGVQAQLLLTPTNDLTALLTLNYSTVTQACCVSAFAGVQTVYTNGTLVSNNYYQKLARIGVPVTNAGQLLSTYTTNGQGWQNTAQDTYGFSSKIDYNFNGYTFESITAFFDWDFHPHNGFSLTPGTSYIIGSGSQITAKSVEQQISVSSPKGGPVETTAGLFYFWDLLINRGKTANGPLAGLFSGSPSTPALINNVALNYLMYSAYDNPTTNEIAPFIQSVWHATPDFDITSGLRYSYNIKSSDFAQWVSSAEPLTGLTQAQQGQVITARNNSIGPNRSWYATTHQGILSALETATYKFNSNAIAYVTASLGGRAGGPNPASGNVPTTLPQTVKAEHLVNFETGLKASWFDDRLITNIAAFTMVDFDYIAYQSVVLGTATSRSTFLANAKRANSRGVELDVRARPVDDVTTFATLTYDDTFYGSFDNAACPPEVTGQTTCSLTGKPLSNTPKWVFVLGGEYSHHLGSLLQPVIDKPLIGYAGTDFTWQSRFFSNYDDSIYSIINPYGILDLHAGVRFEDSSWDLSAWAHNVLNKHFYTQISASASLITATVGAPFEAGFTLRAKF
ncbi:MAG TPA: TonB-dependent receptor [Beijerinckia sp.]|jgi:iron complex outermembrane receptor protein|nr:TonB-dependent receptor [Beijerinckia sp.]